MQQDIERLFRADAGRATATLVRLFGDMALAEEMVQEAFAIALERWPVHGLPASPAGWIITTARNRAIDRLRRESSRPRRHSEAAAILYALHPPHTHTPPAWAEGGEDAALDDQLRLICTCCHPALGLAARVALTLRLIGGLSAAEIARAFLVSEATVAQRLVRAQQKIRAARIPYRVPAPAELPERLDAILATLYLIFNEGYLASKGGQRGEATRDDLCREGIRLARLLVEQLPQEPEVWGLLGLFLLTASRRPARLDPQGGLVRLADQDRSRWDATLIAEGQAWVRACLQRNQPGPYQIQAAIAAVHSDARQIGETDWRQIVQLYDQLLQVLQRHPEEAPLIALSRAIAVAEVEGPAAALALVEPLPLTSHHLYHATRADLLDRLGQRASARAACQHAISLATSPAERDLLSARLQALSSA